MKDSESTEIRAILTYIYTNDYEEIANGGTDCLFDLHIARLAGNYGMTQLEDEAFSRFTTFVYNNEDENRIMEIIEHLLESEYQSERLLLIAGQLQRSTFRN